ncbi:helix-turn-helix domain-containing protein [Photobacterium indicum]|uniref:HTH cro/C1-type domain-containing protein n=1 Tax=Photobacterium indicum TaxID=81447 RepID=A0A2T3LF68_9GAMM|nr:helix-turn-helix transcriptional regulator [Photobacterium indicum]PSV50006.1 hypothetical protein C9J47_05510 [Photobacterium indicum]
MELLKELDKSMSRLEIAEKLNCKPAALSKWMNGKTKPSSKHILHLSQLIGVSAEDLLIDLYPEQSESKQ